MGISSPLKGVPKEAPKVYADMKKWQKENEDITSVTKEIADDGLADETVFGIYENKTEKNQTFDFMEGKDPNNEKDYHEQVLKLGLGDVLTKDIDKDGKVNCDEFVYDEIKELEEGAERDIAVILSLGLFYVIDKRMGNSDDYIDEEEFAQYYTHTDEYVGNGETLRDGKLDIDMIPAYNMFLAEQVETVKEAYEEYIDSTNQI